MLKEYIFGSIEWFLRVQHLLSLTCFRSGHLIVVVFPSIKIYSLLILLLGHIRFQKFAKTASVIMYMECKSLLLNSLSTLPLHTIHQRSLSCSTIEIFDCILRGLFCPFLAVAANSMQFVCLSTLLLIHFHESLLHASGFHSLIQLVADRWKWFANGKLFVSIKCCAVILLRGFCVHWFLYGD